MKNFNFRRFLLTLKWDAKTNIRYNVRHWLIMLTLFFFSILLPHACVITEGDKANSSTETVIITEEDYETLDEEEKQEWKRGEDIVEGDAHIATYERDRQPSVEKWERRVETQHLVCFFFLLAIVWFYFTFSSSLFLNNMTTKQRRIAFLSLPASRSEKLLARWLYAVPMWFLMVVTALCAADLLRYAVQPVIGPYHPGLMITWLFNNGTHFVSDLFKSWSEIDPEERSVYVALFVWYASNLLLTHSTYILGSSLFPRFPWLVTTGIIWVVTSVFSISLFAFAGEGVSEFLEEMDNDNVAYLYGLAILQTLVSIVFYILAVRIFRRMQVINHKFVNL